jgi:hypothetical protein
MVNLLAHRFVLGLMELLVAVILLRGYAQSLAGESLEIGKGNADFLAHYTAAQIIAAGKTSLLYDLPTQEFYQGEVLKSLHSSVRFEGGVLPFVYPPIVALLCVPLSHMPFLRAFVVWNCFAVLLLLLSLLVLIRMHHLYLIVSWPAIVLSVVGFVPFFIAVAQGQNTFIALLFLILAIDLINRSRDLPAGIFLSLVAFKLQLLPLFLAIGILKKRWRMLFGSALGVASMIALSLVVFGMDCCLGYTRLLLAMPSFVYKYGRISFRGQVYGLLFDCCPRTSTYLSLAGIAGLVAVALWAWKGPWQVRSNNFELKMSMTIIVALLISPINFHDLSFLIFPIFSIFGIAARGEVTPRVGRTLLIALLLLGYVLPLAQLAAGPAYRFQPMVLGMLVFMSILLFQIKRAGHIPERSP